MWKTDKGYIFVSDSVGVIFTADGHHEVIPLSPDNHAATEADLAQLWSPIAPLCPLAPMCPRMNDDKKCTDKTRDQVRTKMSVESLSVSSPPFTGLCPFMSTESPVSKGRSSETDRPGPYTEMCPFMSLSDTEVSPSEKIESKDKTNSSSLSHKDPAAEICRSKSLAVSSDDNGRTDSSRKEKSQAQLNIAHLTTSTKMCQNYIPSDRTSDIKGAGVNAEKMGRITESTLKDTSDSLSKAKSSQTVQDTEIKTSPDTPTHDNVEFKSRVEEWIERTGAYSDKSEEEGARAADEHHSLLDLYHDEKEIDDSRSLFKLYYQEKQGENTSSRKDKPTKS